MREQASTPHGCTCSIAAATLPASSPPARISLLDCRAARAPNRKFVRRPVHPTTRPRPPAAGKLAGTAVWSGVTRKAFQTRMPMGYCSGNSLPCNCTMSKPTRPAVRSMDSGDSSTNTPTFQIRLAAPPRFPRLRPGGYNAGLGVEIETQCRRSAFDRRQRIHTIGDAADFDHHAATEGASKVRMAAAGSADFMRCSPTRKA